jgi:hypothetical protein
MCVYNTMRVCIHLYIYIYTYIYIYDDTKKSCCLAEHELDVVELQLGRVPVLPAGAGPLIDITYNIRL